MDYILILIYLICVGVECSICTIMDCGEDVVLVVSKEEIVESVCALTLELYQAS